MKEALDIIERHKIVQKAFRYIFENNPSNYLPYHDLNHAMTVLKYCDYLAEKEEVYFDKRIPLYLGALFHDFNHSGGKLSEPENIENAKAGFNEFAMQENLSANIMVLVNGIIEATEYPYNVNLPHSKCTKLQKIIRDADMMQQYECNWVSQSTLGLAKEAGQDPKKFIPYQRRFLEELKFLTKAAQKFKEEHWSRVVHEFRVLEVSMGMD
jgi:hypothetical protein